MAKWDLKESPTLIPVPCHEFNKVLDEVAELLYAFVCKSENQWLDQNQQNSKVDGNTTGSLIEKSLSTPIKPRRRSAS